MAEYFYVFRKFGDSAFKYNIEVIEGLFFR